MLYPLSYERPPHQRSDPYSSGSFRETEIGLPLVVNRAPESLCAGYVALSGITTVNCADGRIPRSNRGIP